MQPTVTQPAQEQEFRYGWRFVKQDGTLVQIPLTLEDVLHPQEDDHISNSPKHNLIRRHLANVFEVRPLPGRSLVSEDLLVDWGIEGMRNHSLDVAVFVGLNAAPNLDAGTLRLKRYGGRCELAVEIVSPHYRDNDVVDKFAHYHKIGIPIYVVIDQQEEFGPRSLHAYRHTPAGYAEIQPDAQGRIALPVLGLLLGLRDDFAVCYDAATGKEITGLGETLQRQAEDEEKHRQYKDEADRQFTEQLDKFRELQAQIKRQQEQSDEQLRLLR